MLSQPVNLFLTFCISSLPICLLFCIYNKKGLLYKCVGCLILFALINILYLILCSYYIKYSVPWLLQWLSYSLHLKYIIGTTAINGIMLSAYYLSRRLGLKVCFDISKTSIVERLAFVLFFLALLLLVTMFWFQYKLGVVTLEQLIYYSQMPLRNANMDIVFSFVSETVVVTMIILTLLFFIINMKMLLNNKIIFKIPREKFNRFTKFFSPMLLISVIILILMSLNVPQYLSNRNGVPSSFFEEYYIDPKNVNFIFPAQKRNLIVIFIESLETGFFPSSLGGLFMDDLIPKIYSLANGAINFSQTDSVGGAAQVHGTGWTIAGIVSYFTGIPLLIPPGYEKMSNNFLPNSAGIGDILAKEGYKEYFMIGSEAEFGARDKYFKTHGETAIFDYHYYRNNGYLPQGYRVHWGYEDRKLYALARQELSKISQDSEPFFFTMLTIGTHANTGYLDNEAKRTYPSKFKNVLADTDDQLDDFFTWLKSQEFYTNTTVVVLGDHLFLNSNVFEIQGNVQDRRPLNIFINSMLEDNYTKYRQFSHFDIFPALFDSMGIEYDADGVGLGRSMSKNKQTLVELLGKEKFDSLLKQKSNLYDHFL